MPYRALTLALIMSLTPGALSSQMTKLVVSRVPLTPEQLEVYAAFLDSYLARAAQPVYLSDKTVPLSLSPEDKNGLCLQGFRIDVLPDATRVVHAFPASIAKGRPITFVDTQKHSAESLVKKIYSTNHQAGKHFEAGVLSFSEIAFDQSHHFAVLNFTLECGNMCGRFETVVYEQIDGKWRDAKRACSGWIS